MNKLPAVKPREVIRALEKAGFAVDRVKGSHYILWNERTRRIVTVPYHSKDLKPGTLHRIIQQSGLSREEFLKLL